jgi:hypothetical protein
MNTLLITGTCLVFLALAAYSTAFFSLLKFDSVIDRVRRFYAAGVGLDLTATAFMIAGSSHSPLTIHGFIGYTALGLMIATLALMLRFRHVHGAKKRIDSGLRWFALLSYAWWLLAFLAGAYMGAHMKH